MAEELFGLRAQFSFDVEGGAIRNLTAVKENIESITNAVKLAETTFQKSGIANQIVPFARQIKGAGSSLDGFKDAIAPLKGELGALQKEIKNIDYGKINDSKAWGKSSKEVRRFYGELDKLEAQVRGNSVAEREFIATIKSEKKALLERNKAVELTRQALINAERQGVAEFVESSGRALFDPIKDAAKESINLFADFDDKMASTAAVIGATGDSYDKLRQKAKDMGASTRYTASEAAEAMEFLGSAGLNVSEVIESIASTLQLASAGGLTLASAADQMTNIWAPFSNELKHNFVDPMGEAMSMADQMAHVSDVLAQTAAATNTNVTELAEAVKYAGGNAAVFGVSLEELSGIAGAMSYAGIKASNAGTAMRSAFTRLAKPPREAAAAIQKVNRLIGHNLVKNIDGSARNIIDIMKDLQGSLGLSPETIEALRQAGDDVEKLNELNIQLPPGQLKVLGYLKDIFGVTGMSAWTAAISGTKDAISSTLQNYSSSVDTDQVTKLLLTMQEFQNVHFSDIASETNFEYLQKTGTSVFDKLAESGLSYEQSLQGVQSAIAVLQMKMNGRSLNAAEMQTIFEQLVHSGKNYEEVLKVLQEQYGITMDAQGKAGAAAKMASRKEDSLAGSFRALSSAIEGVKIALIEPITPMIRGIVDALTNLALIFANLPASIHFLTSSFVILGGALAGVALAGGLLMKTWYAWESAAATAQLATQMLTTPFSAFYGIIQSAFVATNPLQASITVWQDFIAGTFGQKVIGQAKLAIATFNKLRIAVIGVTTSPLGLTVIGLTTILTILDQVNPEVSILGRILSPIATGLGFVFGLIKGIAKEIFALVKSIFQLSTSPFGATIKMFSDAIADFIGTFKDAAAMGEVIGSRIAQVILSPFTMAIKKIKEAWSSTIEFITGLMQKLAFLAPLFGYQVQKGIAAGSPGPATYTADHWENTFEIIKSGLMGLVNFATGIGQKIYLGLTTGISMVITGFSALNQNLSGLGFDPSFLKDSADFLSGIFKSLPDNALNIGKQLGGLFSPDALGKIQQSFSITPNLDLSGLTQTKLFTTSANLVQQAWVRSVQGISSTWNWLVAIASKVQGMLVGLLNHGSADVVAWAWEKTVKLIVFLWRRLGPQIRNQLAPVIDPILNAWEQVKAYYIENIAPIVEQMLAPFERLNTWLGKLRIATATPQIDPTMSPEMQQKALDAFRQYQKEVRREVIREFLKETIDTFIAIVKASFSGLKSLFSFVSQMITEVKSKIDLVGFALLTVSMMGQSLVGLIEDMGLFVSEFARLTNLDTIFVSNFVKGFSGLANLAPTIAILAIMNGWIDKLEDAVILLPDVIRDAIIAFADFTDMDVRQFQPVLDFLVTVKSYLINLKQSIKDFSKNYLQPASGFLLNFLIPLVTLRPTSAILDPIGFITGQTIPLIKGIKDLLSTALFQDFINLLTTFVTSVAKVGISAVRAIGTIFLGIPLTIVSAFFKTIDELKRLARVKLGLPEINLTALQKIILELNQLKVGIKLFINNLGLMMIGLLGRINQNIISFLRTLPMGEALASIWIKSVDSIAGVFKFLVPFIRNVIKNLPYKQFISHFGDIWNAIGGFGQTALTFLITRLKSVGKLLKVFWALLFRGYDIIMETKKALVALVTPFDLWEKFKGKLLGSDSLPGGDRIKAQILKLLKPIFGFAQERMGRFIPGLMKVNESILDSTISKVVMSIMKWGVWAQMILRTGFVASGVYLAFKALNNEILGNLSRFGEYVNTLEVGGYHLTYLGKSIIFVSDALKFMRRIIVPLGDFVLTLTYSVIPALWRTLVGVGFILANFGHTVKPFEEGIGPIYDHVYRLHALFRSDDNVPQWLKIITGKGFEAPKWAAEVVNFIALFTGATKTVGRVVIKTASIIRSVIASIVVGVPLAILVVTKAILQGFQKIIYGYQWLVRAVADPENMIWKPLKASAKRAFAYLGNLAKRFASFIWDSILSGLEAIAHFAKRVFDSVIYGFTHWNEVLWQGVILLGKFLAVVKGLKILAYSISNFQKIVAVVSSLITAVVTLVAGFGLVHAAIAGLIVLVATSIFGWQDFIRQFAWSNQILATTSKWISSITESIDKLVKIITGEGDGGVLGGVIKFIGNIMDHVQLLFPFLLFGFVALQAAMKGPINAVKDFVKFWLELPDAIGSVIRKIRDLGKLVYNLGLNTGVTPLGVQGFVRGKKVLGGYKNKDQEDLAFNHADVLGASVKFRNQIQKQLKKATNDLIANARDGAKFYDKITNKEILGSQVYTKKKGLFGQDKYELTDQGRTLLGQRELLSGALSNKNLEDQAQNLTSLFPDLVKMETSKLRELAIGDDQLLHNLINEIDLMMDVQKRVDHMEVNGMTVKDFPQLQGFQEKALGLKNLKLKDDTIFEYMMSRITDDVATKNAAMTKKTANIKLDDHSDFLLTPELLKELGINDINALSGLLKEEGVKLKDISNNNLAAFAKRGLGISDQGIPHGANVKTDDKLTNQILSSYIVNNLAQRAISQRKLDLLNVPTVGGVLPEQDFLGIKQFSDGFADFSNKKDSNQLFSYLQEIKNTNSTPEAKNTDFYRKYLVSPPSYPGEFKLISDIEAIKTSGGKDSNTRFADYIEQFYKDLYGFYAQQAKSIMGEVYQSQIVYEQGQAKTMDELLKMQENIPDQEKGGFVKQGLDKFKKIYKEVNQSIAMSLISPDDQHSLEERQKIINQVIQGLKLEGVSLDHELDLLSDILRDRYDPDGMTDELGKDLLSLINPKSTLSSYLDKVMSYQNGSHEKLYGATSFLGMGMSEFGHGGQYDLLSAGLSDQMSSDQKKELDGILANYAKFFLGKDQVSIEKIKSNTGLSFKTEDVVQHLFERQQGSVFDDQGKDRAFTNVIGSIFKGTKIDFKTMKSRYQSINNDKDKARLKELTENYLSGIGIGTDGLAIPQMLQIMQGIGGIYSGHLVGGKSKAGSANKTARLGIYDALSMGGMADPRQKVEALLIKYEDQIALMKGGSKERNQIDGFAESYNSFSQSQQGVIQMLMDTAKTDLETLEVLIRMGLISELKGRSIHEFFAIPKEYDHLGTVINRAHNDSQRAVIAKEIAAYRQILQGKITPAIVTLGKAKAQRIFEAIAELAGVDISQFVSKGLDRQTEKEFQNIRKKEIGHGIGKDVPHYVRQAIQAGQFETVSRKRRGKDNKIETVNESLYEYMKQLVINLDMVKKDASYEEIDDAINVIKRKYSTNALLKANKKPLAQIKALGKKVVMFLPNLLGLEMLVESHAFNQNTNKIIEKVYKREKLEAEKIAQRKQEELNAARKRNDYLKVVLIKYGRSLTQFWEALGGADSGLSKLMSNILSSGKAKKEFDSSVQKKIIAQMESFGVDEPKMGKFAKEMKNPSVGNLKLGENLAKYLYSDKQASTKNNADMPNFFRAIGIALNVSGIKKIEGFGDELSHEKFKEILPKLVSRLSDTKQLDNFIKYLQGKDLKDRDAGSLLSTLKQSGLKISRLRSEKMTDFFTKLSKALNDTSAGMGEETIKGIMSFINQTDKSMMNDDENVKKIAKQIREVTSFDIEDGSLRAWLVSLSAKLNERGADGKMKDLRPLFEQMLRDPASAFKEASFKELEEVVTTATSGVAKSNGDSLEIPLKEGLLDILRGIGPNSNAHNELIALIERIKVNEKTAFENLHPDILKIADAIKNNADNLSGTNVTESIEATRRFLARVESEIKQVSSRFYGDIAEQYKLAKEGYEKEIGTHQQILKELFEQGHTNASHDQLKALAATLNKYSRVTGYTTKPEHSSGLTMEGLKQNILSRQKSIQGYATNYKTLYDQLNKSSVFRDIMLTGTASPKVASKTGSAEEIAKKNQQYQEEFAKELSQISVLISENWGILGKDNYKDLSKLGIEGKIKGISDIFADLKNVEKLPNDLKEAYSAFVTYFSTGDFSSIVGMEDEAIRQIEKIISGSTKGTDVYAIANAANTQLTFFQRVTLFSYTIVDSIKNLGIKLRNSIKKMEDVPIIGKPLNKLADRIAGTFTNIGEILQKIKKASIATRDFALDLPGVRQYRATKEMYYGDDKQLGIKGRSLQGLLNKRGMDTDELYRIIHSDLVRMIKDDKNKKMVEDIGGSTKIGRMVLESIFVPQKDRSGKSLGLHGGMMSTFAEAGKYQKALVDWTTKAFQDILALTDDELKELNKKSGEGYTAESVKPFAYYLLKQVPEFLTHASEAIANTTWGALKKVAKFAGVDNLGVFIKSHLQLLGLNLIEKPVYSMLALGGRLVENFQSFTGISPSPIRNLQKYLQVTLPEKFANYLDRQRINLGKAIETVTGHSLNTFTNKISGVKLKLGQGVLGFRWLRKPVERLIGQVTQGVGADGNPVSLTSFNYKDQQKQLVALFKSKRLNVVDIFLTMADGVSAIQKNLQDSIDLAKAKSGGNWFVNLFSGIKNWFTNLFSGGKLNQRKEVRNQRIFGSSYTSSKAGKQHRKARSSFRGSDEFGLSQLDSISDQVISLSEQGMGIEKAITKTKGKIKELKQKIHQQKGAPLENIVAFQNRHINAYNRANVVMEAIKKNEQQKNRKLESIASQIAHQQELIKQKKKDASYNQLFAELKQQKSLLSKMGSGATSFSREQISKVKNNIASIKKQIANHPVNLDVDRHQKAIKALIQVRKSIEPEYKSKLQKVLSKITKRNGVSDQFIERQKQIVLLFNRGMQTLEQKMGKGDNQVFNEYNQQINSLQDLFKQRKSLLSKIANLFPGKKKIGFYVNKVRKMIGMNELTFDDSQFPTKFHSLKKQAQVLKSRLPEANEKANQKTDNYASEIKKQQALIDSLQQKTGKWGFLGREAKIKIAQNKIKQLQEQQSKQIPSFPSAIAPANLTNQGLKVQKAERTRQRYEKFKEYKAMKSIKSLSTQLFHVFSNIGSRIEKLNQTKTIKGRRSFTNVAPIKTGELALLQGKSKTGQMQRSDDGKYRGTIDGSPAEMIIPDPTAKGNESLSKIKGLVVEYERVLTPFYQGMVQRASSASDWVAEHFRKAPERTKKAWEKAEAEVTGKNWKGWRKKAYIFGKTLVAYLNHGAADVTGAAWDRNTAKAEGDIQHLAQVAKVEGKEIAKSAQQSSGHFGHFFKGIGGLAQGGWQTGMAIGGVITGVGFAAQQAVMSLSTMGLIGEEANDKLYKFMELFQLLGTIGMVVQPVIALITSTFGTFGATLMLLANPITLYVGAIAGGIFLLNEAFKALWDLDFLAPIMNALVSPFQFAIARIEIAWQWFAGKFGNILMPIIQPAIDMGKQLVAWLNHGAADVVGEAWVRTGNTIQNTMGGVLSWGQGMGAKLVGAFAPKGVIKGVSTPVVDNTLTNDATSIKAQLDQAAMSKGGFLFNNLGKKFRDAKSAQLSASSDQIGGLMASLQGIDERSANMNVIDKLFGGKKKLQAQKQEVEAKLKEIIASSKKLLEQVAPSRNDKVLAMFGIDPEGAKVATAIVSTSIDSIKTKTIDLATEFKEQIKDRTRYLQRYGGKHLDGLFMPDVEKVQDGFGTLFGSVVHFGKVAGTALLHLDFKTVWQETKKLGENAWFAIKQIAGGLAGLALSTVTWVGYMLVNLPPTVLILGAIALGAFVLMTNFLGIRTILSGIIKLTIKVSTLAWAGILSIINGLKNLKKWITDTYEALKFSSDNFTDGAKAGEYFAEFVIKQFKEAKKAIVSAWGSTIESIKTNSIEAWGSIKTKFESFKDSLVTSIKAVPGQVTGAIAELKTKIQQITFEDIVKYAKGLPQEFGKILKRVYLKTVFAFGQIVDEIKYRLTVFAQSDVMKPFIFVAKFIGGFFKRIWQEIATDLSGVKEKIENILKSVKMPQWLLTIKDTLVNDFKEIATNLGVIKWFDDLKQEYQGLLLYLEMTPVSEIIKDQFQRFKEWVGSINWLDLIKEKVTAIQNWFATTNIFESILTHVEAFNKWFVGLVDNLRTGWQKLQQNISGDLFGGLFDGLEKGFANLSNWFLELGSTLDKWGFGEFFTDAALKLSYLSTDIAEFIPKVKGWWSGFADWLGDTPLFDNILGAISWVGTKFGDLIPEIKSYWLSAQEFLQKHDLFTGAVTGIQKITGIIDNIVSEVKTKWQGLTSWFSGVSLFGSIQNNGDGTASMQLGLVDTLVSEFNLAIDKISSAWRGFVDNFPSILGGMVDWAVDTAIKLINALNHNPTERIPEAWRNAINSIIDMMTGWVNRTKEFGENITTNLLGGFKEFKQALEPATTQIGELWTGFVKITKEVTSVDQIMFGFSQTLKGLFEIVSGLVKITVLPLETLGRILIAVKDLGVFIYDLGVTTTNTFKEIGDVIALAGIKFDNAKTMISDAIAGIKKGFDDLIQAALQFPKDLMGGILKTLDASIGFALGTMSFDEFKKKASDGIEQVIKAPLTLFEKLKESIGDIWTNLKNLKGGFGEAFGGVEVLVTGIAEAFEKMGKGIKKAFGKLKDNLNFNWQTYRDNFDKSGKLFVDGFKQVFGGIEVIVKTIIDRINELISIGKQVQDMFKGAGDSISTSFKQSGEAIATFKADISNTFDSVTEGIQGKWKKATGFIGRLFGKMEEDAAVAGDHIESKLAHGSPGPALAVPQKWAKATDMVISHFKGMVSYAKAAGEKIEDALQGKQFKYSLAITGTEALNNILPTGGALGSLGLSSMPKTIDALKAAYHAASKQAHPDLGGSTQKQQDVNAAYEQLKTQMRGGLSSQEKEKKKGKEKDSKVDMQKLSYAATSLGAVISNFAPGLATPLFFLNDMIDGFDAIKDAMPSITTGIANMGAGISAAGGLMPFIVAQWTALTGAIATAGGILPFIQASLAGIWTLLAPLMPLIVGVVAVGVGMWLAWKNNFLGFQDAIKGFFGFFGNIFGQIWAIIGSVFTTIEFAIRDVQHAFGQVGNALIEPFKPFLALFGVYGGGSIFSFIGKVITTAIITPFRVVANVINFVVKLISGILQLVVPVASFIANFIVGFISKLMAVIGIIALVANAGAIIGTVVGGIVAALQFIVFAGTYVGLFASVATTIGSVIATITGFFGAIVSGATTVLGIISFISAFLGVGILPVIGVVVGVISAIAAGGWIVYQIFNNIFVIIAGVVEVAWNLTKQVFGTLLQSLGEIWNAIKGVAMSLLEPFIGLFKMLSGGSGGMGLMFVKNMIFALTLPLKIIATLLIWTIKIVSTLIVWTLKLSGFLISFVLNPVKWIWKAFMLVAQVVIFVGKLILPVLKAIGGLIVKGIILYLQMVFKSVLFIGKGFAWLGGAIWNALKFVGGLILKGIVAYLKFLWQTLVVVGKGFAWLGGQAWNGLKAIGSVILSLIVVPFKVVWQILKWVGQGFMWLGTQAFKGISFMGGVLLNLLIAPFKMLWGVLQGIWSFFVSLGSFIVPILQMIGNLVLNVLLAPFNAIKWTISTIISMMGNIPFIGGFFKSDQGGGESAVPGFASGGLVGGKGGPTSDNIFARLSPGEFVVNAQATKDHYGTLQAINDGGQPSVAVMDRPPLAPLPEPTLAGAGASATTAIAPPAMNFNINFGDIILSGASGPELVQEFLEDIEPKLEQRIREILRTMLEFMK
jgi:TP901 family phage tail tape measure protein